MELGVPTNLELPNYVSHQTIEFPTLFHNSNDGNELSSQDTRINEDTEKCFFRPLSLIEELLINDSISLKITQADSAFQNGIGSDETGGVVWGAALCLASYLSEDLVKGKKVMELGCGGGVPSLTAHKYGAGFVVATDFELNTLERMDYHTKINQCNDEESFEIRLLDWEHHHQNHDDRFVADVIMASDVIYGHSKVPSLVRTIDRYLTKSDDNGKLLFATRNGRKGVQEFLSLMAESGFVKVKDIPCVNGRGGRDDIIPQPFQGEDRRYRWQGDHTIHIFKREENEDDGRSQNSES